MHKTKDDILDILHEMKACLLEEVLVYAEMFYQAERPNMKVLAVYDELIDALEDTWCLKHMIKYHIDHDHVSWHDHDDHVHTPDDDVHSWPHYDHEKWHDHHDRMYGHDHDDDHGPGHELDQDYRRKHDYEGSGKTRPSDRMPI